MWWKQICENCKNNTLLATVYLFSDIYWGPTMYQILYSTADLIDFYSKKGLFPGESHWNSEFVNSAWKRLWIWYS